MIRLSDKVSKVSSKDDLAAFIAYLLQDLRNNAANWENATLESFLGAMCGWVEDMEGYYENRGEPVPQSPSWKTFAEILAASKSYE